MNDSYMMYSIPHPDISEDSIEMAEIELDMIILVHDSLDMLTGMIEDNFENGYGLTKRGIFVLLKRWSPDHDDILMGPENERWNQLYEENTPIFACYMIRRPKEGLNVKRGKL